MVMVPWFLVKGKKMVLQDKKVFTSRLRHGHTEGDVGKSVRPLAHFGPQN